MTGKHHNQRCPECKRIVRDMLAVLFGKVETNFDLKMPCKLEDYENTDIYGDLQSIYEALKNLRGFDNFVRASKLPRVDYYVPSHNLIIEFDESQHFTKPRDIALSLYSKASDLGFSVEKWRMLCQKLDEHDNDPAFRDEQRAWYDTLRDFAPKFLKKGQITRAYSNELIWCSLNPQNKSDQNTFKQILNI